MFLIGLDLSSSLVIVFLVILLILIIALKKHVSSAVDSIRDNLSEYGAATLPIFFSLGQILISDEFFNMFKTENLKWSSLVASPYRFTGIVIVIISVPLWLISIAKSAKKLRRVAKLEEDLADKEKDLEQFAQNVDAMVKGHIFNIGKDLDFGTRDTNNERITLYHHDPTSGLFVPFGRYSSNPEFEKDGKSTHRDSAGCIAEAWQHGRVFENDFPDPASSPEDYMRHSQAFNLKPDEIKKLKMKSRLYFGWRIVDTKGQNELAVFIVESTDKDRWTREELEEYFESKNATLSSIIESFSFRSPNASLALKENI